MVTFLLCPPELGHDWVWQNETIITTSVVFAKLSQAPALALFPVFPAKYSSILTGAELGAA